MKTVCFLVVVIDPERGVHLGQQFSTAQDCNRSGYGWKKVDRLQESVSLDNFRQSRLVRNPKALEIAPRPKKSRPWCPAPESQFVDRACPTHGSGHGGKWNPSTERENQRHLSPASRAAAPEEIPDRRPRFLPGPILGVP